MIYLDHNATSPLRPEARAAMERALDVGGNPSSVHAAGRAARAAIEEARDTVAAFAGASSGEVIFTSGGAESNALALRGAIAGAAEVEDRITRLFVVATAHDSVRAVAASLAETTPGLKLYEIAVDANGRIDRDAFRLQLMSGKGRALVSLVYVNNESGVIDDIAGLSKLVRTEAGDAALIHVDAVSSGYCPINFRKWGVDYLSLSAHKIGGPQGVGALIVKVDVPLAPLFNGFQEMRRRGGTENLSGIAGFAAAIRTFELNRDAEIARVVSIRDRFESKLGAAAIFARDAERAPNTSSFAFLGLPAETALMALDLDGICVSSGAACSSGKVGRSHVLAAMGVPGETARCVLRVSFGWNSAAEDADAAIASLEKLIARVAARKAA
ncbi:MAG TPA: cysteine desulfurase family protein [Rhizomicrobium sp.]|nr:cysteine desulfurase family protein [Rhizomicrobium sp.]